VNVAEPVGPEWRDPCSRGAVPCAWCWMRCRRRGSSGRHGRELASGKLSEVNGGLVVAREAERQVWGGVDYEPQGVQALEPIEPTVGGSGIAAHVVAAVEVPREDHAVKRCSQVVRVKAAWCEVPIAIGSIIIITGAPAAWVTRGPSVRTSIAALNASSHSTSPIECPMTTTTMLSQPPTGSIAPKTDLSCGPFCLSWVQASPVM